MEFKEYCSGRWIMFLAGLFWMPLIPAAYALLFRGLMRQNVALIILITLCFVLLLVAAVVLLKNGIAGLIAHGRTRLILLDDKLQIVATSGKGKGTVTTIDYPAIMDFCFSSRGTKQDKTTGLYYVAENARGLLIFNVKKTEYAVSVYNAYPAAAYILERLQEEQIDALHSELNKSGKYTPKD